MTERLATHPHNIRASHLSVSRVVHPLIGTIADDGGAISNSIQDLICLRHRRRLLLWRHAVP
jgi:hypothetical protein